MRDRVSAILLGLTLAFAAPAAAGDQSDSGVLPWSLLDLSKGSAPASLPFRLQLTPRAESPSPMPALVPHLSVGRIETWEGEPTDVLRVPRDDRNEPVRTGAGLTWWLGPRAEITGEYQFMGVRGLSLRPSAIERNLDTGLDAQGFSFSLSIKY